MPTDEERRRFKEGELEAARAIMAGDRYCPDPSIHERGRAVQDGLDPERLRQAIVGLDAAFQWIGEHYPKALVAMPREHFRAFGIARQALSVDEDKIASALHDPAGEPE